MTGTGSRARLLVVVAVLGCAGATPAGAPPGEPAGRASAPSIAAPAPVPVPAGLADAVARLEETLSADVVADSVGSVAAAVFVGDAVVWSGAFGWADRATRTLATSETLYRAGSITKTVTALVLLRMVEAGVIALDDPVATHLPELDRLPAPAAVAASHARAITFRQLAAHTTGVEREPDRAQRYARGAFREWRRRAIEAIPDTRTLQPPGHRQHYSNIGYAWLGLALERAAGRPFEALADSLVLRPLGMRSATFDLPGGDPPGRLAVGYVNVSGDSADPRVPRAEHRGRGYRVPSGGLYATVRDLARLGMALTGARPLVADSLRQRMATAATAPNRRTGYGIGVQVLDLGDAALVGHSGTTAGYTAYLLVDPERQTGVVLLRNYNRGATNLGAAAMALLLDLRSAADGDPPDAGRAAW